MPTITKTIAATVEVTEQQLRDDLIKQIVDVGPEHFDMNSWFRDGDGDYCLELSGVADIKVKSCGTTACLGGHAVSLLIHEYRIKEADLPFELDNSDALAEFFGFDDGAFSSDSSDWPAEFRLGYLTEYRVSGDERIAQWRGALTYLVSLQDD